MPLRQIKQGKGWRVGGNGHIPKGKEKRLLEEIKHQEDQSSVKGENNIVPKARES